MTMITQTISRNTRIKIIQHMKYKIWQYSQHWWNKFFWWCICIKYIHISTTPKKAHLYQNPRVESYGSNAVSVKRWCNRWRNTHQLVRDKQENKTKKHGMTMMKMHEWHMSRLISIQWNIYTNKHTYIPPLSPYTSLEWCNPNDR